MLLRRVQAGASAITATLALAAASTEPARAETPTLAWADCGDGLECATAQAPLDYHQLAGKQIALSLIRIPAGDPSRRIGTLFTNPGGPGNSGVDFVRDDARAVYSPELLARFDIVGFDPRGVGRSTPVRCFASPAEQALFAGSLPAFPVGRDEERAFAAAQADLGRRCLERNPDLLGHISTANVARDLDLLRRAVGDDKLSFVGHSYGSLLGATYANLFPGRVRAIALDGVLDPVGWTTGRSPFGAATPFSLRVGSQRASSETLRYFLDSCKRAGERCAFSAGDPVAEFDKLMARLRVAPVELDLGDGPVRFGYADVVNIMRDALGFPPAWGSIAAGLDALRAASEPATAGAPPARRAALIGIEGAGHTQAAVDSSCADRALARYLVARELPAAGATCPQDSEPFDAPVAEAHVDGGR